MDTKTFKKSKSLPAAESLNIFHIDLNYVNLKKEYLHAWMLKLKEMGFNAILWELEDKVQWETCPECVWPEAMSKKEFKELLSYSKSLGLEPIPLLQTVGHAEYVLLHKNYHSFRELDERHDCYCTSNAKVTRFLKSWIEEYIDLFGEIKYSHLGGDEAYVFGTCQKCSAYAEKYGINTLFGNHIKALAEPLLKKNIRPGIWNDMIMKNPEALDFDKEMFIIWDWNYCDNDKSPKNINLHNLGRFSQKDVGKSAILKKFPELIDNKGKLRSFGSVRLLKKHGFDVILCSASRSHGDTLFCPHSMHSANIAGAAKTVISENLHGHCVTSWATRLNDYLTQIPYIGLAGYSNSRWEKSSEELLNGYCRQLFGTDPEKFIKAISMFATNIPFSQSTTTGVQWNSLKDSLPAPRNYLKDYFVELKKIDHTLLDSFPIAIKKATLDIPEIIRLLTEFFGEAKKGFDIIDAWLTGAHFLLRNSLIGEKILKKKTSPEFVVILEQYKKEYKEILSRRETPLSAEKNAGLVYDVLLEYFKK